MPQKSAGQVNYCRDYCPICTNHTTRLRKPSKIKKKLRGDTRKFSFGKRQKFLALRWWGDNWPRSQSRTSGDDSKLINLATSRIKVRYFGRTISTICQANTLKTECVVHWIAERETAGLTLWFQSVISWVNALFVCKFDPFPKCVLSSNRPKFPTFSLFTTP